MTNTVIHYRFELNRATLFLVAVIFISFFAANNLSAKELDAEAGCLYFKPLCLDGSDSLANTVHGNESTGDESGILSSFPLYTKLTPNVSYYSDNQKFSLIRTGAQLEFGVFKFLAFGVSFNRFIYGNEFNTSAPNPYFTTFKYNVILAPSKYLSIGAGFGQLAYQYSGSRGVGDWNIKFENPNKIALSYKYEKTDGVSVLNSVPLVYERTMIDNSKFEWQFQLSKLVKCDGHFTYLKIFSPDDANAEVKSPGINSANDIQIRLGRKYGEDVYAGYEYQYVNFSHKAIQKLSYYPYYSALYYSPKNFQAHSIWGEYDSSVEKGFITALLGKIGYSQNVNDFIGEISAKAEYKIGRNFIAAATASFGNSFRDSFISTDLNQNYQYLSVSVSAIWSID